MKRSLSILAALTLLCGCTSTQLQTAATDTTAAIGDVGAAAQTVSTICSAPQTAALINQAAGTTAVADPTSAGGQLLADATAACTADGQVAATLAPNLNTDTPTWLTGVLQGLSVAADVAPYIVPLL